MGLIAEIQGISIRSQCELLEVSRSTVYYTALGESPENLELMRILDEPYPPDQPRLG
jgi:putative transposase